MTLLLQGLFPGPPEAGIEHILTALLLGMLASSLRPGKARPSKLAVFREISTLIQEDTPLRTVLEAALQRVVAHTGMDLGWSAFFRNASGPEPVHAQIGTLRNGLSGFGGEIQHDPIVRRLASIREPIILAAIPAVDEQSALVIRLQRERAASCAIFPLQVGDRVVGIFVLASRTPKKFTQSMIRMTSVILGLICLAVSESHLREQSGKLAEDLVSLQEMNKIISQSLNLDEIILRIVVEGKRLVKTDECHLFLLDDRKQRLVGAASTQTDPDIRTIEVKFEDPNHLITSFTEKQVLAVDDLAAARGASRRLLGTMKWRSAIFAPLLTKEEAIGVLVCSDSLRARSFTREEIVRAETLAHQAAIAMENARLFQVVSRSQKEWETTFDAMQDCVSVHDTSGKVVRANLALARRLGTTPPRVIGKHCSDLYSATGSSFIPCRHTRALQSESLTVEEVEVPLMGGTFQVSVSPWYDKNNRLAGSIHVAKDMTHEKLLQQQLIQSEKLSAIGELISGIAHELNNPLTGVMGYSQLLQMRKDLDERTKDSLAKINSLALRCQKIVQNLLSFARKQKPERITTDMNEIIERTIELRNYDLQVNNIEIVRDLDPDLPETIADAHQLQQVVLNLITNAEQAMLAAHGRGRLVVRTSTNRPRTRIIFEIIDDGPGIPEAHLSKVFDPFFTTKEVGQGTGLGLSLSYGIIQEHDGKIFARSKPGQGATFVVELPVVAKAQGELDIGLEPTSQQAEFERLVRDKRILVVDDEKYILDFFVEVFKPYPLRVDTAENGRAAVEKMQVDNYDVIITDFKMPEMSGRELFHWVKSQQPHLSKRVIFVTGDTVSAETRTFFESNTNPFLAKPFKIDEVKEVIRHTLSGID